jgi:DNA invertase Pin-like site-specific DNA recombinase
MLMRGHRKPSRKGVIPWRISALLMVEVLPFGNQLNSVSVRAMVAVMKRQWICETTTTTTTTTTKAKRAAIYIRVSTDGQTTENQRTALEAVAAQRGWTTAAIYDDAGISGSKGRDKRLFLHQQAIDTTTPAGRMFFHVTGAFAEFERDMIRSRVNAGLDRARARGVRLGRPTVKAKVENAVRDRLMTGDGMVKIAKALGIGVSTVQRIRNGMKQAAPH